MDLLDGAEKRSSGGRHAKRDRRARTRALRLAGRTYDEIVAEVGVSKSTVSLWVRDYRSRRRAIAPPTPE